MKTHRVLLVDDNAASTKNLKSILTNANYEIIGTATSSTEALSKAGELHPDLVILDADISGEKSGNATARAILDDYNIPVLYLSDKEQDLSSEPFSSAPKELSDKELLIGAQLALYKSEVHREIQATQRQIANILTCINDAIVAITPEGNIDYINPAAEVLIGSTKEKVINHPAVDVIKLLDKRSRRPITEIKSVLMGFHDQNTHEPPYILQTFSGREHLINIQTLNFPKSENQRIVSILIFQEVTELHNNQLALGVMTAALESIETSVAVSDADISLGLPKILFTNHAFERLTGHNRNTLEEFGMGSLFVDESMFLPIKKAIATKKCFSDEIKIRNIDGIEINIFWNISCLCDTRNEVTHLIYSLSDVSELRQIEENVRQSQKIEGIGKFTGGIAHDFNNILSVVNSYSDLLALKVEDEKLIRYIQNIRKAGEKGAKLVAQLMGFSRRNAGNLRSVKLKNVLEDTKDMLERVISEDIELEIHSEENVHSIYADLSQIEQILVNLCVNARDAIKDKGQIFIRLYNEDIASEKPEKEMSAGQYVVLSVKDTGCGMDIETQKKIFEPFFTTKDFGKGTGLGLATVYGIIKKMGGLIELISEPDKGTEFKLYFPKESQESKKEDTETQYSQKSSSTNITILAGENNLASCITGLFYIHGYNPEHITSDQDLSSNDSIDLLIVDIDLDAANTFDIIKKIKIKNPSMHVLVMADKDIMLPPDNNLEYETIFKPCSLNAILSLAKSMLTMQHT